MKKYSNRTELRRLVTAITALFLIAVCVWLLLQLKPHDAQQHHEAPEKPLTSLVYVTVPKLGVEHVPAYYGPSNDEKALHDGLLHVAPSGFPWQDGANVYIAGHDLGFPGTPSWHIFWNLDALAPGDKIIITDSQGTQYTYRVYKQSLVGPYATRVMQPKGKSVVSLQTCRPHWVWDKRLIVCGELVHVAKS